MSRGRVNAEGNIVWDGATPSPATSQSPPSSLAGCVWIIVIILLVSMFRAGCTNNTVPPVTPNPPQKIQPGAATPLPPPVPSKLETPTVSTISATGSNAIRVTWNPVSNASGYWFECATNMAFVPIVTSGMVDVPSTEISGLNANTAYYVRVMAVGTGRFSNSDYSTVKSVTTTKPTPDSPVITASAIDSNGIRVTWNPVGNASNYVIEYATNSAFTTNFGTIASTTTRRDITGLNPNTTYYVRVMALGTAGKSDYSTVESATTLKLQLGTPRIINFLWERDMRALGIVWTRVNNVDRYHIEYTTDPNFRVGIRTITAGPTLTSWGITGLNANTVYYIRIKAVGTGYIDSDYSIPIWYLTPRLR